VDSNSGWQEVISSEEVTTTDVTTEYWNAAPHPQLAHLPQLPHPLSSNITTVSGTIPSNVTITKKSGTTTKIVPIGLSRVQVVPAQSSPVFLKILINDATITTSTSNKNNNNKTVTAITTTTTSTAGGHLVKGKQRKFNILWEHNYA